VIVVILLAAAMGVNSIWHSPKPDFVVPVLPIMRYIHVPNSSEEIKIEEQTFAYQCVVSLGILFAFLSTIVGICVSLFYHRYLGLAKGNAMSSKKGAVLLARSMGVNFVVLLIVFVSIVIPSNRVPGDVDSHSIVYRKGSSLIFVLLAWGLSLLLSFQLVLSLLVSCVTRTSAAAK
jgi:hypothetical protein